MERGQALERNENQRRDQKRLRIQQLQKVHAYPQTNLFARAIPRSHERPRAYVKTAANLHENNETFHFLIQSAWLLAPKPANPGMISGTERA